MNELGLLLLTAVLAVTVVRAPLTVAFATLVTTVLVIPGSLVVPNGFTAAPSIVRVVLWAFAFRLVWASLRPDRPTRTQFWAGPVTAALGLFVLASLLLAVAMAPATAVTWSGALRWLGMFDQLVMLGVALGSIRLLGPSRALRLIVVAAGVMTAIAVIEHLTGASWGALLFRGVPEQFTDAARQLGVRAGETRVRVGAEFPLQFGWMAAVLVPPVILVATSRWRTGWPVLVAALLPLTVTWSVTRSASAALVPLLVLAMIAARDRRFTTVTVAVTVAAAGVVLLSPDLLGALSPSADVGAIDVRAERLPRILEFASEQRILGLGLSGLRLFGFSAVDSAYLLTYAEQGVVGLTLFVVAGLVALAAISRGLSAPPPTRRIVAVSLASCVGLLASGFAFDTFSTLGSAHLFWLLVALGVVAAEEVAGPTPFPVVGRVRFALPVAALVIGAALATFYPVAHAGGYLVTLVPPLTEALGGGDPQEQNQTLVASVCGIADRLASDTDADVWCRELPRAAGVVELRIEADDAAAVTTMADGLETTLRTALRAPDIRLFVDDEVAPGQPTAVATAPLWLPLGVLGLMLLAPSPWAGKDPRSRRRVPLPQDGPVEVPA